VNTVSIFRIALAAFLLALLPSCQSLPQNHPDAKARVSHMVVCWLKHSGDEAERAKLIAASESFREIPGVTSVSVGSALASARPAVDSSFDVAMVIGFESKRAMADYEKNPKHVRAARTLLLPLARKFVIYDFVNE
jgi:hypothetical protein